MTLPFWMTDGDCVMSSTRRQSTQNYTKSVNWRRVDDTYSFKLCHPEGVCHE